jgi:hypothetical protein
MKTKKISLAGAAAATHTSHHHDRAGNAFVGNEA